MLKNLVIKEKMPNFATATKTMVSHPVGANGNRSLSKVGYFNGQSTTSGAITTIAAAVQKEDCSMRGSVVFVATGRAAVPFSNRLSIKTKVMKKETEIWKDVEGTDGQYQVSNLGRVRSMKKYYGRYGNILVSNTVDSGHLRISLMVNGKKKTFGVHQLVARAFVSGCKPGLVVNHKDENPANNRADNLEWISKAENNVYGLSRKRCAESNSRAVIKISDTGEIVARYKNPSEAAVDEKVHPVGVRSACRRGKKWHGFYWKYEEKPIKVKVKKLLKIRSLKGEIWRDVLGYEGLYKVSSIGRVKSVGYNQGNERLLTPGIDRGGYEAVVLYKNKVGRRWNIHRLVAFAFLEGYQDGMVVNHKDENRLNNHLDNLEWLTNRENLEYGTTKKRLSEKRSKPVSQYSISGEFIKDYPSLTAASNAMNSSIYVIANCCKGVYNTACGYKWKFKKK